MSVIAHFDARLLRVDLRRPWAADVTSVGVIATHVVRDDGVEGWGLSWTPQIGLEAIAALLRYDITSAAVGRDATPGASWQELWTYLHEAGGGGITTIALAGLDTALWDAEARARGVALADLAGRTRSSVRTYGSGVNLHYSLDELLAQVRRWVDSGFSAVKIKVGKDDISEDVDRVGAVREILGAERGLMIDANQRWDLAKATTALERLATFKPAWIEEPLRADDLAGHAELARRSGTPIAVGENLHTAYRFAEFLDAGAARILQPNVVRVGGITPFLRIAREAADAGATVHPHLLPELSGQLAMALPDSSLVEDVEDAGFEMLGALIDPSPVQIEGGVLTEREHVGLGIRFISERTRT